MLYLQININRYYIIYLTIPYSHFPLPPMLGVITLIFAVACYYGMSEPPSSGES